MSSVDEIFYGTVSDQIIIPDMVCFSTADLSFLLGLGQKYQLGPLSIHRAIAGEVRIQKTWPGWGRLLAALEQEEGQRSDSLRQVIEKQLL